MIFNSDHIVTGVMGTITTEIQGRKTISKCSVKIEDVISSDCKPGDVITVQWETYELSPIHHEFYKDIQVVWLLQKKGDIYYANHPERVQSLKAYEVIYNEINSYTSRVYLPETYYWEDQAKPVLLIFRNIEGNVIKLPVIEWQDKILKLNENIHFVVFPITSFNRERTILGKDPLAPIEGKIQILSGLVKELKPDDEYRVWVNLNEIYKFLRPSYYSVSLEIKGFPSQSISAFETRNRMKISAKFDFLTIAKDRFASESKKHTIQAIIEAVGEKTPEAAYEKISSSKSLRLANLGLTDISPLGSFPQLEYLDLSGNNIKDLNPIRQMRNLVFLDLSNNQISDIEVLSYIGSLNFLDLSRNEISNISSVKNQLNMFFLFLNNNDIDDISMLDSLKRLRILDLSKNEIDDVKSLGKLLLLQELYLQENSVKVLDALTYSKNLLILDVRKNPVSYVEHFETLIQKHQNDFGATISLKLLHDAYNEKGGVENKNEPQPLLPKVGEKSNFEVKENIVEEKKESFSEQVKKAGIVIEPVKNSGNVVEFLEKENLVLVQFKKDDLPKVDDLLTVFRKDDYIGTVKVIELVKEQAVCRISTELLNDKKLTFTVGDLVQAQK